MYTPKYTNVIPSQVGPVSWLTPGTAAGLQMLEHFLEHKLKGYAEKRNDPNQDLASNLSPYLHFGQVGDSCRSM